jgi:hypothetical protein
MDASRRPDAACDRTVDLTVGKDHGIRLYASCVEARGSPRVSVVYRTTWRCGVDFDQPQLREEST